MNASLILVLVGTSTCAQAERVTCAVNADTWVDAPPFGRPAVSPASENHGVDPQLVINGRNSFALLQFDLSGVKGIRVEKATLRVRQAPGLVPLTMVGVSTVSGSGPWNEGQQRNGAAAGGSANYYFAQAGRQPWSYPGSDLADVTFGLGGSLYAYRQARAIEDGWFEIDVPLALVAALASGDQFGWMLTDEKGQTRTRHVLSSREGQYPPVLIVEGSRAEQAAPGAARSLKKGREPIRSSIAEARALGFTTLAPGSVILSFGGAGNSLGSEVARYELRYSAEPINPSNFTSATPVPRWSMDPLAPKTSALATQNSLRDEVIAVAGELDPGRLYYFAARAFSASGSAGPVSPLGRYQAFSRTFPQLPAQPAGPRIASAADADGGAPGPVRVWAVPELLKIDPKTGSLLELSEAPEYRVRNSVWNAATSTVRLTGSRNEFVACQLAIESAGALHGIEVNVAARLFGGARLPDVFRDTGAVQLYREWFVPDDKDTSPNRPWYPDPLLPLRGPLDLPAADNAVPGQTVQPIFVDVYVPQDAAPGIHKGSLLVRAAGGFQKTVTLEIEVLPLRLPQKLNFIVDLNAYGGVNSGYSIQRGTPEYHKLLHQYHRVAHLNRANLDILGYSHSGTVEPDQAPPLSGDGADTKVASWKDWDAHYGPLLDGSAFADLPRASVPVPIIYLALFENWPGDLRKNYRPNDYPLPKTTAEYQALIARHGLDSGPIEEAFTPEYQARFSAVAGQFAQHVRERNWLRTQYQVFFNDKYFYKDPALSPGARGVSWWLLDEPNHRDDYRALAFFAWLAKLGLAKYPDVPLIVRADISYVDYMRDQLTGLLDLNCTSQHFFTKNRFLLDHRDRFGKVYWNYASTNHPRETNVGMRAWCWRAWIAGADGIVPWNTVRGMEAWDRAEPLTVFYAGKKFGVDKPFDSLRLKAFRRGQQDIEYLVMLAGKNGWDREAVSRAVASAAKLSGGILQRSEEDAGVVSFQQASDSALDQLRLRVAGALARAGQ
jgi:hypothetical protein